MPPVMQPITSAGKIVTVAKRGKTSNWYQARENMQPILSAGKRAVDTKRGKKITIGPGFAPDWLKKPSLCALIA